DEGVVGKSVRRDLAKGKLTLPLIRRLASAEPADRGKLLTLIQQAGENGPGADAAVDQILADLRDAGAIETARSVAREWLDRALPELDALDDTPARSMLRFATEAVVERRF
ncbi:MAG: octaprenyl-diphosphate synthase, partial [Phycisphaerae bacterium]|nr:octaprenyl-diphosphate synthase [Phycisphaerae bacterium]